MDTAADSGHATADTVCVRSRRYSCPRLWTRRGWLAGRALQACQFEVSVVWEVVWGALVCGECGGRPSGWPGEIQTRGGGQRGAMTT